MTTRWPVLGLAIALAVSRLPAAPDLPSSPQEIYGELFLAAERAHVFPDQKTFPDCVPRGAPGQIVAEYEAQRDRPGFDLGAFVRAHFLVPETRPALIPRTSDLETHLSDLWEVLRRPPDRPLPGSSLLPLPYPYVVPGGRFREMYYWDSYFTMLGLRESGRQDLIRSMLDDFASELGAYGLVPNGNRTYYLSRSQPPFFALMVELAAERDGLPAYLRYAKALETEYAYWTDREFPTRHTVILPGGDTLSRYWDRRATPRDEAFAVDEDEARKAREPSPAFYRDVRSAAESGWDFSSRWLGDGRTLASIETTDIVPVDLNCLLYQLERTLAAAYRVPVLTQASMANIGRENAAQAALFEAAAEKRRAALLRVCWSEADGYFFDYDLRRHEPRHEFTLAGVVPLFLKLATPQQADAVARTIERRFLRPGGVVTTLTTTGQQWDAPNGWAPLEYMTVRGLENYGHIELAREIAQRWLKLNREVYARTGKLMEKYNVEDLSLLAGGGEYPSQDGFGWTNGVFLALEHDPAVASVPR